MNLNLRLVGLHGFRGCGKDTISDYLVKTYSNCVRISFGDMLRKELSEVFDIEYDSLFERSKDYEFSTVKWSWFPEFIYSRYGFGLMGESENTRMTYRELMQIYATDYVRFEDADYWLTKWKAEVNSQPEGVCIIAPDVRFANESKVFMEHGVMIRINDAIPREAPPHPSDALLPNYHFEVDGKGIQSIHGMCQDALEACKVQQFVLNDKQKVLHE